MVRRTAPPRLPAGPPANAEDGAARVRAALVKLFDRKNGMGADWRLMLESLYRAGFLIVDQQPDDARRSLMRRVHEGAEARLTGGYADGSGPGKMEPGGAEAAPSNTAGLKSSTPRPPH